MEAFNACIEVNGCNFQ